MRLMLPDIRYFRYFYEDEGLSEHYNYMQEIERAFETDLPPPKK